MGVRLNARQGAATESLLNSSVLSLRSFQQQAMSQEENNHFDGYCAIGTFPPWTPTKDLPKRKTLPKRMQHLLQVLDREREIEAKSTKRFPDFKAGDVLELKLSIPENKHRVTTFRGICIARKNCGYRTSFTLRNVFGGSGGIERTFPLYSPHILEMKITDSQRVRRAKLFYLRDRKMNRL